MWIRILNSIRDLWTCVMNQSQQLPGSLWAIMPHTLIYIFRDVSTRDVDRMFVTFHMRFEVGISGQTSKRSFGYKQKIVLFLESIT